jgi:hypothetical protein
VLEIYLILMNEEDLSDENKVDHDQRDIRKV